MKNKLFYRFLFLILFFLLLPLACMAQTATNGATATPAAPAPSPWLGLIAAGVPVLLAIVKILVPNIPRVWIPILAPVLGAAADIALHFAGVGTGNPLIGAVLGGAGVGLREIFDQLKQVVTPTPAPSNPGA